MSVEILAPVGNKEMLVTAINNGADAVYLGGSYFNARMKAENFDDSSLTENVRLCHLHNKKVYLTLNTLINDDEILLMLKQVNSALKAGVDAFIVQDLGIAYILKNHFKDIVLHASTQLGIHNLEGAIVAEKLGFKRVVLSREATLEDIKQIKQNTNLEIEYFVHGALCVAFSGNCYLSSFVKNKSGNRGECLQLCRLFYNSYENSNDLKNDELLNSGYLLSTRDLAYFNRVKDLVDAGVNSFKIEGRLKRPAYVATTVKTYKDIVSGKQPTLIDEENLRKVFSRGEFNKGQYLDDKNSNIINKEVQNHLGIKIGTVVKVDKFKDLHKIFIKSNHNLMTGDGLKFVSKQGYVNSLGVGNVERLNNLYVIYSKTYPNAADDVYLTVDVNNDKTFLNNTEKVRLSCSFVAKIGEKAKLTLCYKNGDKKVEVNALSNNVCEKAKTSSVTKENIIKNINKLKETEFELNCIKVDAPDNLFIPLVEINNMRRSAIKEIEDKIIETNSPKYKTLTDEDILKLNDSLLNEQVHLKSATKELKTIRNVNEINSQSFDNYDIIYSPEMYSLQDTQNFNEKLNNINFNGQIYYDLPIIENYKDIKLLKNILNNNKEYGVVVNNIYGLTFAGNRKTIFGIYLNITNKFALRCLLEFNSDAYAFKNVEKWNNLQVKNLLEFNNNYALMTFKHCPFKLNYGCDCKTCDYKKGLVYKSQSGSVYKITRKKIVNCYFQLMCIDNKD